MISEALKIEIVDAIKSGMILSDIRKKYHIGSGTLSDLRKEFNINPRDYKNTYKSEIIKLRKEGMTYPDIQEKLGCSLSTIRGVCEKNKLTYSSFNGYVGNQFTSGNYDRLGEALRKYVDDKPWEYVEGFEDVDSPAMFKCTVCGYIQQISFISMRHRVTRCNNCLKIERAKKQEQRRVERERQKEEQIIQKWLNKPHLQIGMRFCGCGQILEINDHKRCNECRLDRARLSSNEKDKRRLKAILDKPHDSGINAMSLYEKYDGICYLCGERCDIDDREVTPEGIMKYYKRYPSVEHVVPLSKGGTHTWNNVRLAHIGCNSKKGAG